MPDMHRNGDQIVTIAQDGSRDGGELAGTFGIAAGTDLSVAGITGGPVSLPAIRAALRRRIRFLCAIAVAGLLVGLGVSMAHPAAYQASATLLLTPDPGQQTGEEMPNDVAIMLSNTVAERAMHELGLPAADSLVGTYAAKQITDRIMTITVNAPSSGEAVRRANALAAAFLRFRAGQLQAQQNLVLGALSHQIAQSQQNVASLASQIAGLSGQPATPSQQARLKTLRAQRRGALNTLAGLQGSMANYQVTTTSAVAGSAVLDPAAPTAREPGPMGKGTRIPVFYAVMGLIPGLALGALLVVVMELASDRMRRREDVARALGAPVRLSVRSRLPGRRGRGPAAAGGADARRIAAHLRGAVPASSRGPAALAVVAVDNARAAALPLVSLALSCAREGLRVVLADLSGGSHAARLAGAGEPGVRPVSVDGASLVVAVPGRDDPMASGPLRQGAPRARTAPGGEALADACASADLVLALLALDPALGADHLATWATDAVVVVTAGRSTWAKLHAVGEMIRLAGTRLASVVLIGADPADESLGTAQTPNPPDNVVYWPVGQM